MADDKKAVSSSKKKKFTGINARAYILSSFNNTIVNITDDKGNTLTWSSSGVAGFKGTKKGTPFAAQTAASVVGRKAIDMGVKSVAVYVNGPGSGRETAIRGLQASGLAIVTIRDITPVPHDGCRPPKPRRV